MYSYGAAVLPITLKMPLWVAPGWLPTILPIGGPLGLGARV